MENIKVNAEVTENRPIPKYAEIKENIKREIANGKYRPKEMLPTELWFSEYYNASRTTIRKALEELIEEGIIYRERSVGTYVAEAKVTRKLNQLTSLFQAMKASGIKMSSDILSYSVIKAADAPNENLKAGPNDKILRFERIRLAEGKPLCYQIVYLQWKLCKGLDVERLVDSSLYEILEKEYEINIEHSDISITAKVANAKLSSYLETPEKTPMLYIEHIVHTDKGEIIEYSENWYVASRYKHEMTIYR